MDLLLARAAAAAASKADVEATEEDRLKRDDVVAFAFGLVVLLVPFEERRSVDVFGREEIVGGF